MQTLEVPFEEREAVKQRGGKWNAEIKKWECKASNKELYNKYKPVYLQPPYSEKDTIKSLGAKWDSIEKKWVIANYKMNDELKKYVDVKKIYLDLPFELKDYAKRHKAQWDKRRRMWFFLSCQTIPENLIEYLEEEGDTDEEIAEEDENDEEYY